MGGVANECNKDFNRKMTNMLLANPEKGSEGLVFMKIAIMLYIYLEHIKLAISAIT